MAPQVTLPVVRRPRNLVGSRHLFVLPWTPNHPTSKWKTGVSVPVRADLCRSGPESRRTPDSQSRCRGDRSHNPSPVVGDVPVRSHLDRHWGPARYTGGWTESHSGLSPQKVGDWRYRGVRRAFSEVGDRRDLVWNHCGRGKMCRLGSVTRESSGLLRTTDTRPGRPSKSGPGWAGPY